MTVDKDVLRFEAIRHRDRMDLGDENPDAACMHFFKRIPVTEDTIVAAYWPKGREIDTSAILEELLTRQITCALPIVMKDSRVLKFVKWNDATPLAPGKFGIFEPAVTDDTEFVDPDIVITPLLAFDRQGYRIGYGGGYYDATLADLRTRKKVLAVGLAYAQQAVIFNLPREDHDQKLDWVITPSGAHNYTAA